VHAADGLAGCLAALPGARLFYGEEAVRRESSGGASGGDPMLDAAALLRCGIAERDVLVWVVGPEGGWTEAERRTLAAAGAAAVRLGPHRLRTETAAAAGLVLLQAAREARLAGPS
jgi:16S rRNA U1498 N3-methylase RsmE